CGSAAHLEGDFEEMESRLVYLETLCCQCEQQTVKQHHVNQLEVYKKKKRLTNISDQEALDDFLNSTNDDDIISGAQDHHSTGSSLTSGPDLESCSSESSSSQSTRAPPTTSQASNQDAEWEKDEEAASEESDEPLVQSDEEEVQPDMSLVGLQDVGARRGSDESDPAGDLSSG
ncbi:dysbindin-A-like, partial [Anarrhichthys ocellatus]|uniref:dysbindin-A-like n=1 Tax=Anarrhichthys ocellatus TaxID=433405 RepID=UPI0012EE07A2